MTTETKPKRTKFADLHTKEKLKVLIKRKPSTKRQLAQAINQSERNTGDWLKLMHDAKEIHIKKWVKPDSPSGKGNHFPVWTIGPGVDAVNVSKTYRKKENV